MKEVGFCVVLCQDGVVQKVGHTQKNGISAEVIRTVASIVKKIPWAERHQSMAQVTVDLLDGRPRVAEEVFGWSRSTVELGMHELRTGIRCLNDISNRHRTRTEDNYPEILQDIHAILEPESQADPQPQDKPYLYEYERVSRSKGSFIKRMEQKNTTHGKNNIGYFESARLCYPSCCKN